MGPLTPAIAAGDRVSINPAFLIHLNPHQRRRNESRRGSVSSVQCEHRAIVSWDDGNSEFSVIDVDNLQKVVCRT